MKKIFCVWNAGNKGKTETLRELANFLIAYYPATHKVLFSNLSPKNDFRFVVEINKKIIAVESQGDPGTHLETRLLDIHTTYLPDIIVCSSRTRGETINAVEHVANANSYDIVYSSTYDYRDPAVHTLLNAKKAEHIHDLFVALKLI